MNAFVNAVNAPNMTTTTNGMAALDSTGDKMVSLFFNIGAARNNPNIVQEFMAAFGASPLLATKCLFWARDVRGGAGERKVFRDIIQTLEIVNPDAVLKNVHLVPFYGRWDDLLVLHVPAIRQAALKVFAAAISAGDGLACKWAPRKGEDAVALTKTLGVTPRNYRKMVVAGSNTVEQKMCAGQWDQINYGHVPSVASARYQQAFGRHNATGYGKYIEALKSGDAKINASVIFPHDVIKSVRAGNPEVANAQWDALPNYVGDRKILPVSDVSGSMSCRAGGGKTTCMEVSIALGLYLASKNTGAFKDVVCTFSEHPALVTYEGDLATKVAQLQNADWGGSTNLEATFKLILQKAVDHNVPQSDMPELVCILSDMQFNQACGVNDYHGRSVNYTALDMIKAQYQAAGYTMPGIIFWNLNGEYGNFPSSSVENGVVMVSGFSPTVMKSVLACDFDKITPVAMMLEVLDSDRYAQVTV